MKTTLNKTVKESLLKFGDEKTFDWNMEVLREDDGMLVIGVYTVNFQGLLTFFRTSVKECVAVTYCTSEEIEQKPNEVKEKIMEKRLAFVQCKNLPEFIEKLGCAVPLPIMPSAFVPQCSLN
jgi:hypothetical protein